MYSTLHPLTSGASIGLNLYNDSENLLQCTKKLLQKNALHHQGEHHFSLGLGSSMVLCLCASWGGCGGGLAARVPSLKELMALPCTMQCCRLMKNCGRAPRSSFVACALPWCSAWLQVGEVVKEALLQGCQASKSSWPCHASCNLAVS